MKYDMKYLVMYTLIVFAREIYSKYSSWVWVCMLHNIFFQTKIKELNLSWLRYIYVREYEWSSIINGNDFIQMKAWVQNIINHYYSDSN